MFDVNSIWQNASNILMETMTSLYNIVDRIFQLQMLQSILNILKGIGYIMVAVVEMILKLLRMIVKG
jgi:hypothetical protein